MFMNSCLLFFVIALFPSKLLAQNPAINSGLFKKYRLDEITWKTHAQVISLSDATRFVQTVILYGILRSIKLKWTCLDCYDSSLLQCGAICKHYRNFKCVFFALENGVCQLGQEVAEENAMALSAGQKSVYYMVPERQIPGSILTMCKLLSHIQNNTHIICHSSPILLLYLWHWQALGWSDISSSYHS